MLVLTARNRTEGAHCRPGRRRGRLPGKRAFDLDEVEARLKAALVRRTQGTDDLAQLGQLVLDRKARRFLQQGQPPDLPAREPEVLPELMSPAGRVVSPAHAVAEAGSEFLTGRQRAGGLHLIRGCAQQGGACIRTLRGPGCAGGRPTTAPEPAGDCPCATGCCAVTLPLAGTWLGGHGPWPSGWPATLPRAWRPPCRTMLT